MSKKSSQQPQISAAHMNYVQTSLAKNSNPYAGRGKQGGSGKGGRGKGVLTVILIIALVVVVLAGVFAFLLLQSGSNLRTHAATAAESAQKLGDNLEAALVSGDSASIVTDAETLDQAVGAMRAELDGPVWSVAALIPGIGGDVAGARTLLGAADDLLDNALTPAIDATNAHPLGGLVRDGSIDGAGLVDLCSTMSGVAAVVNRANAQVQGLGSFETEQLEQASVQFKEAVADIDQLLGGNEQVVGKLPALLGCEGVRTYLLVAQNPAQLRATGGIATAMVPVTIDNGVIMPGDPTRIGDLPSFDEAPLALTDEELSTFGGSMAVSFSNMNLTPEYTRAAQLFAQGWQAARGQAVDGVIAFDAVALQRLLDVTGSQVTLSNGAVLTGRNAAPYLLHDLYWNGGYDDDLADALFAEGNLACLNAIRANLPAAGLQELIDTLNTSAADGHLLIWMASQDDKGLVSGSDYAGELPLDPTTPVVGVYLNDATWGMADWFLDASTSIGKPTRIGDGSLAYDLTLTVTNRMTSWDLGNASSYVLGYNPERRSDTDVMTTLVLYAPAGGYLQLTSDDPVGLAESRHNGLQVVFGTAHLSSQESCQLTFRVVVAPEATESLQVRMTPTLAGVRASAGV